MFKEVTIDTQTNNKFFNLILSLGKCQHSPEPFNVSFSFNNENINKKIIININKIHYLQCTPKNTIQSPLPSLH